MMNYEKNIDALNEIVGKLSNQKMSLDDSVKLYEDAQKLYLECSDYLEKQTGKVYKIKQDLEKYNEERMN